MSLYLNSQQITKKYSPLYEPVFFSDYLIHIFNDENDYEILEKEMCDEKIMLTLGHYYLLEENDMNKAKYFYDKVKNLGSSMGSYSMSVYFYTKNAHSRSRLYATTGLETAIKNTNNISNNLMISYFKILLFKISVAEDKLENAEMYLVDEIKRLEKICTDKNNKNDKTKEKIILMKIVESLCFFYLNVKKDGKKLMALVNKYFENCDKFNAIVIQHYYNVQDADNMLKYTKVMVRKGMIMGNYYMGMYNYIRFVNICKNGLCDVNLALELLENCENWLESVVANKQAAKEFPALIDHSDVTIKTIKHYKNNILNLNEKLDLSEKMQL